jgi:hypothetical protein
MKGIPWWIWLVVGGGALYLATRSGSVSAGSQIYVPAGTQLYTDAALTQGVGATSVATVTQAGATSGSSTQITVNGTPYYINASQASVASAAQISANQAGTLT